MLAVGRLVRIVKTIGDKVISKSRFYNTFNYRGIKAPSKIANVLILYIRVHIT